jgi:hypothetical protein
MRFLLPALLLASLSAAPVAAEPPAGEQAPRIYRWVDANGVAHYTTDEDRIPASLRRRFGVPTRPMEHTPLEPGAPEPTREAPDAWAVQERGNEPPAPTPTSEETTPEETTSEKTSTAGIPDVSSGAAAGASRLARVELRIAELSAAIAADEDMLSAWLADPDNADVVALGETPQFREVAARRPKRIQELEALVTERDALTPERDAPAPAAP